jgi:hypothetical protein
VEPTHRVCGAPDLTLYGSAQEGQIKKKCEHQKYEEVE